MDVTGEGIQDVCTDAVFKRGENYLAESRVLEIHRVDATVTAVVSGSRQYHVRVDLAVDGFDPWCDCPYDGPGACKHVVAVLLRCLDDVPPDEGDQLDAALDAADPDGLRAFLRDALATDAALRERFFARFGGPSTRSVDELRAAIDRRFEETNPEYYVVFEPIDFSEWFDLADEYREQGRNASAATVYWALVESLDDKHGARRRRVRPLLAGVHASARWVRRLRGGRRPRGRRSHGRRRLPRGTDRVGDAVSR